MVKEDKKKYHREYMRKWIKEHEEEWREYQKKYHKERRKLPKVKEYYKKRYLEKKKDPEWIKRKVEMTKRWEIKNPNYKKEYLRRKRHSFPKCRIDCNMASIISTALKGQKAGRKWESLVDYTLEDLMRYFEMLFDKHMNWDNYGSYWEIDHLKPRSLFKYETAEDPEFEKCWALENLRPLEVSENRRKGDKYFP